MKKIFFLILLLYTNIITAQVSFSNEVDNEFVILNLENKDAFSIKLPYAKSADRIWMEKSNPGPEDGMIVYDPETFNIFYYKKKSDVVIPDYKGTCGYWIQLIDDGLVFKELRLINTQLDSIENELNDLSYKYNNVFKSIKWATFKEEEYDNYLYKNMNLKYGVDYFGNIHVKGDFILDDSVFINRIIDNTNIKPQLFIPNYYPANSNAPGYVVYQQECDTVIVNLPSGLISGDFDQFAVAKFEAISDSFIDDCVLLCNVPVIFSKTNNKYQLAFNSAFISLEINKFSSFGNGVLRYFKFHINTVFYRRN